MDHRRKERKRVQDRDAQRAARARTKARIAQLEATVAALTGELQKERSRHPTEIVGADQLQPCDAAGSFIALEPFSYLPWNLDIESDAFQFDPALSAVPFSDARSYGIEFVACSAHQTSQGDRPDSGAQTTATLLQPPPSMARNPQTGYIDFARILRCSAHENFLEILDNTISFVERLGRQQEFSKHVIDEDIVIRAVLHGWPAVERRYTDLDLGWQLLKALDEAMWLPAGFLERIANLTMSRCVFIKRTLGNDNHRRKLPAFMSPTKLQRTFPNRAIANYVAWPDGREAITKNRHLHLSQGYAREFAANFQFKWHYELRDAYLRDCETDTYALSERLITAFNDLQSFQRPRDEFVVTQIEPELWTSGDAASAGRELRPFAYPKDAMGRMMHSQCDLLQECNPLICISPELTMLS